MKLARPFLLAAVVIVIIAFAWAYVGSGTSIPSRLSLSAPVATNAALTLAPIDVNAFPPPDDSGDKPCAGECGPDKPAATPGGVTNHWATSAP
jgi:hypothetical protein